MCLGQTMREVWGQAGFYEVLLDVTVSHWVPGLRLDCNPIITAPAGGSGLCGEEAVPGPLSRGRWG